MRRDEKRMIYTLCLLPLCPYGALGKGASVTMIVTRRVTMIYTHAPTGQRVTMIVTDACCLLPLRGKGAKGYHDPLEKKRASCLYCLCEYREGTQKASHTSLFFSFKIEDFNKLCFPCAAVILSFTT